MKNKKLLLGLFFGIFLIIFSYSVIAVQSHLPTLVSPVAGTNYTTTLSFECTHRWALGASVNATGIRGIMNVTNATLWYSVNTSGVVTGNTNTSLVTVANTTAAAYSMNQTYWNSTSVSISSLPQSAFYNFTCELWNATDSLNATANTSIIIDYTNPNVSAKVYPTYNGSYSGVASVLWMLYINVTLSDNLDPYVNRSIQVINTTYNYNLGYKNGTGYRGNENVTYNQSNLKNVYFKITNSAGTEVNATMARRTSEASSTWFAVVNITNSTNYPTGRYNITIYVNDSAGNINNSEVIEVIIDNNAPVVTLTSSLRDSTSLKLTVTADEYDGYTCTSSRTAGVFSSSYGFLTESSLACGKSYTYTITCVDTAGNSGASSATAFSTISCSGAVSGSSSSGTSTTTWTSTLAVTNTQFEAGYTQELKAQERMKVSIGGSYHHVGVKSVTATSATIEISSEPVSVTLKTGQDAKVDVDNDKIYDLYVKLNSITSGKADVTVKKLSETVPEGEGSILTSGKIETTTPPTTSPTDGTGETGLSKTWIYVIVIIVVLAVVGVLIAKRKK